MISMEQYRLLLLNPSFRLEDHCDKVIHDIKFYFDNVDQKGQMQLDANELVELLMLRLRNVSPHVYAITVGQFSGFDGLDNYWDSKGFIDTDGYHWLKPKPFGPYMEHKFHD